MSAGEAVSWRRFFMISGPVGYERDEFYSAMLCALIHNVNVGENDKRPISEFVWKPLPHYGLRPAQSDAEEVLSVFENADAEIAGLEKRFRKKTDHER